MVSIREAGSNVWSLGLNIRTLGLVLNDLSLCYKAEACLYFIQLCCKLENTTLENENYYKETLTGVGEVQQMQTLE